MKRTYLTRLHEHEQLLASKLDRVDLVTWLRMQGESIEAIPVLRARIYKEAASTHITVGRSNYLIRPHKWADQIEKHHAQAVAKALTA